MLLQSQLSKHPCEKMGKEFCPFLNTFFSESVSQVKQRPKVEMCNMHVFIPLKVDRNHNTTLEESQLVNFQVPTEKGDTTVIDLEA